MTCPSCGIGLEQHTGDGYRVYSCGTFTIGPDTSQERIIARQCMIYRLGWSLAESHKRIQMLMDEISALRAKESQP